MNTNEFHWSTTDGLKIYGKEWPVKSPRAVVALVHGFGEHINRYNHLAAYFNEHRVAVIGYDRRGHGRSQGKRGHTLTYNHFLDEVAQLTAETEARYDDTPTFLYGHSMGGNLVLNYILRRHPVVEGAIVTGAWIQLAFQPSAALAALGKFMRTIYPGFTQSNQLNPELISSDRKVVEQYIADPLVHDRITSSTGIAMLNAADWLDEYRGAFSVPLLMMHGGDDKIIDAGAAERFSERVKGDVTFKLWEGLYHEIHNEPQQKQVFDFTLDWITAHSKERGASGFKNA